MSKELKPCPFCGWGTICEVITVPFRYKCGCHACGASTASYRTWDEAVEAWNTRTPEQAIADELNAATGGMEGDGLPSVEWGRIVTGLIAAHYDNDEERFRERAVKAAKMYDERGKYEVAEYITAQYCPSTAFVPM